MSKDKEQDQNGSEGELLIPHAGHSNKTKKSRTTTPVNVENQAPTPENPKNEEAKPVEVTNTPEASVDTLEVENPLGEPEKQSTPSASIDVTERNFGNHQVPRDLYGIEDDVEKELQKTNFTTSQVELDNNIVVPGGVSDRSPDPNKFFGSVYKKPHRSANPYSHSPENFAQQPSVAPAVFGNIAKQVSSVPNAALNIPGKKNPVLGFVSNNMGKPSGLVIIAGSIAGLIVLILVVVFAVYLPGKPENVYKSGLKNTSKSLVQLEKNVLNQKYFDSLEKQEISGTFESTATSDNVSGIIRGKIDGKKAALKLESSNSDGAGGKLVSAEYLLNPTDHYPNLYYKATGMERIGGEKFAPMSQNNSNKWILVDQAYFKSLDAKFRSIDNTSEFGNLFDYSTTSNDFFINNGKVISTKLQGYFFTEGNPNSVLVYDKFLGKENVDGKNLYHYQIKLSKTNFNSYCKEVVEGTTSQETYAGNTSNVDDVRNSLMAKCDIWSDNIVDEQQNHDIWVSKGGIVNKIKINNSLGGYSEYVLNSSGNKLSIGYNYQFSSDTFVDSYNYTIDYKTKQSSITYNYKNPSQSKSILYIKMNLKPTQNGIDNLSLPKPDLLLKDIQPIESHTVLPSQKPSTNPSDIPDGIENIY